VFVSSRHPPLLLVASSPSLSKWLWIGWLKRLQWMTKRCNTPWVNERAITVQFDSANVVESIASFLIVRPAYAWLGYGAGIVPPKWNDAFLWDVGVPKGECRNGSEPGTFERDWTCVCVACCCCRLSIFLRAPDLRT
jgi:hypothetical protein